MRQHLFLAGLIAVVPLACIAHATLPGPPERSAGAVAARRPVSRAAAGYAPAKAPVTTGATLRLVDAPASTAPAGGDFFRPGPLAPTTLPTDGIYPQGATMHIGGYSPAAVAIAALHGAVPLELAKSCGFTVAGPFYGPFEKSHAAMERAAALGLHVAVQLEVPPALIFGKEEARDALTLRGPRMAALSDDDLRAWVQSDMNQVLHDPDLNRAVSCWAISPEELRSWFPAELKYQQAYVKSVNDFDPMHRPVYMYEPNNRTTENLLKTGPGQGFIVEGTYVSSFGWDVNRSLRIDWAMDQMQGAASIDQRVVVPGLQLSQDLPGFSANDLAADAAARGRLERLLRHDVYLAIVRGAQGFQVWSLFHSRKNLTTYLDLMEGYGKVFRELTSAPENLQKPILFGERRRDIGLEITDGPAFIGARPNEGTLNAVEGSIKIGAMQWPSVRLANIAYGAGRVLIVVNSAAVPVSARLTGIPGDANVTTYSGSDAATMARSPDGAALTMQPFAAVVLKVLRS